MVTQPYDKISPAMQQAYYQRSPYNLVRIILGLPELFDAERGESVYTRAARDFRAWREQGVLIQEKDPCIFAYSQRFRVPETDGLKERRGFIALGKLHDYAEQVVFRHEQTLSKPKSDRLNLLKATHAHFGQIFMLYSDPGGSMERILYDGNGPAEAEVTDEYGVLHRLWTRQRPGGYSPADHGHGRQEAHHRRRPSPLRDRAELLERARTGFAAHDRAQHQPVAPAGIPRSRGDDDLRQHGLRRPGDSAHPPRGAQPSRASNPPPLPAPPRNSSRWKSFPTATPPATSISSANSKAQPLSPSPAPERLLLRPKPDAVAAALASLPERQRQLDLNLLHSIVLDRLLGLDAEKVREQTNIRYLRDAAEAVEQVRPATAGSRGEADIAFLTNPVTMEQLREVAFAGEVMPQKSTDFFPKLLSGLTIYALE